MTDGGLASMMRSLRAHVMWTQEDLAERSGVSVGTIAGIESGRVRRPRDATLRTLADAMSLSERQRASLAAAAARSGSPLASQRQPGGRLGSMPAVFTSLVGRREESEAARSLLLRPSVRLVTLTGPGGVGKTRLALEVVSGLDAGLDPGFDAGLDPGFDAGFDAGFDTVAFVALAAVRDPRLVPGTIARALGLAPADDAIDTALRAYLRAREMLLVLDNMEQVLESAPALADLLRDCPRLTILATSRARLRISAEHVVTVGPLALPDEAVRLFVERAQAVLPAFVLSDDNAGDVAEICRRLDGLPLAIELAAARVTVLPPAAMLTRLARLERRLPVLTGGPREMPERLRTMRAGIAWSYDLLPSAEQALFRRLGVFADACTLAAAESVAGPHEGTDVLDLVSGLVDKSLLQRVDDHDEPRFGMLETIREYALEQLVASGEERSARLAHAVFLGRFAESVEEGLRGSEQQRWMDALEAELANIRGSLSWTLRAAASPDEADQGLQLAGALWYFWFQRGLITEGRHWLVRSLDLDQDRGGGNRPARARALLGAGCFAWRQGDCDAARTYLEESVATCREIGDQNHLAEALHVLGHAWFDQSNYETARVLFMEGLEIHRNTGGMPSTLPLVDDLGLVSYHQGDYATAEAVFRDSLALYRQYDLKDRVAGNLNRLGDLARLAGDHERATGLYQESLSLWRELRGTQGIASALHKLGQVSRSRGDTQNAGEYFRQSLALQREVGNQQGIAECLAGLAGLLADAGRLEPATRVLAAVSRLLESTGAPLAPADQVVLVEDRRAGRVRLGDPAWRAAWDAGSNLSTERAIAVALTEVLPEPDDNAANRLTRREREVCALIARGLTNREIASALSISEKTAGSHVEHIMNKLDLRSRTRIAVWAVHVGMIPDLPSQR